MCCCPSSNRSDQISSLTTVRLCRWAKSASASRSARSNTVPVGLWGWQSQKSFVAGETRAASRSQSIVQAAVDCASGTRTTRRPAKPGSVRNGGYTGVNVRISSLVSVSSRALTARAFTTPGVLVTKSGSTFQPWRRCKCSTSAGAKPGGAWV